MPGGVYRVRYFGAAELVDTLYRALADNSVGRVIEQILRADVVMIDLCRPGNYADRQVCMAVAACSRWAS